MSFGLQSTIPDRALPDAISSLIVMQVDELATFLEYAQNTANAIRANNDLTAQDKSQRIAALNAETRQRLTELEHKNIEVERQIGEFQVLLKQQRNPILEYTLERVISVLRANLNTMREQLDAILLNEIE